MMIWTLFGRCIYFQPLVLPQLDRPMAHFDADTVLTEMGTVLAQMVGRGLLINKTLPGLLHKGFF